MVNEAPRWTFTKRDAQQRHQPLAGQRAGSGLLVSGAAGLAQLFAGLQELVSLSERRKQRCMATALHPAAGRGGAQVRSAVIRSHLQG